MHTDALILRTSDYRDADRIVTLFTRDAGKLSAIARGARGSRRRFAGALEPYAIIRVELEGPRGELYTLKRAEISNAFRGILADLARMDAAGAALALLREAHAPAVPDEALFLATLQYLTVVDHQGDDQRAVLALFALRVLALIGLAPRLEVCGRSGERVPSGRPAYFDPELGAVVSKRFGGGPFLLSASLRERLVAAQRADWLAARVDFEVEDVRSAQVALAAFVRSHFSESLATRLFP